MAIPQLLSSDFDATFAYFQRLGFEVEYTWGEPPFYAMVRRGEARLNVRRVDALPEKGPLAGEPDMLSASIPVRNVKALFEEFLEGGVEFHQRLRQEPWGGEDFIVADPDGNLVLFGSAVPG
jgi:uncharacterized glyoxalase superfamily protein PhnB